MEIPIVTKYYLGGILFTALLCHLDLVTPYKLYFNPDLVVRKLQFWRLITPFLYYGSFNLELLISVYVLLNQFRHLELMSFRNRNADFLYMLIFFCSSLLVIDYFVRTAFLSSALEFAVLYVWSRLNPNMHLMLILFPVRAPYAPYGLMAGTSVCHPPIVGSSHPKVGMSPSFGGSSPYM
ncbi:Der1-like protein [Rozella allomycis CSF55]|uniref:Derlin n=1 Tax=Rozella allomycis (strain CSF55) TaxID=988480 RepID=A0A4P9YDZ9_ROZAC|nr:Der1-like protein [Rozella allomycis CSF55]